MNLCIDPLPAFPGLVSLLPLGLVPHCRWKLGICSSTNLTESRHRVCQSPALPSIAPTSHCTTPRHSGLSHTATTACRRTRKRFPRFLAPGVWNPGQAEGHCMGETRLGCRLPGPPVLRDTRRVDNLVGLCCVVSWFPARKDDARRDQTSGQKESMVEGSKNSLVFQKTSPPSTPPTPSRRKE